jgi:hypothetical protein
MRVEGSLTGQLEGSNDHPMAHSNMPFRIELEKLRIKVDAELSPYLHARKSSVQILDKKPEYDLSKLSDEELDQYMRLMDKLEACRIIDGEAVHVKD